MTLGGVASADTNAEEDGMGCVAEVTGAMDCDAVGGTGTD